MNTQKLFKALLLAIYVAICSCNNAIIDTQPNNQVEPNSNLRTASGKHVLFIGIDGLQYEKMANVSTPNLDKLNISKGFTGGIMGTPSEQSTYSGPGWATLLTGVWFDKHGVPNNSSSTYKSQAKSIFAYVKEAQPNAEIASVAVWSPIHEFMENDMSYVDRRYDGGDDAHAVTWAVNDLQDENTDLLFVHLDNVDHVGHASGWGSAYNNAIAEVDVQVGTLLQAVEDRIDQTGEDWLIIVATDHGRDPSLGYSHGNQTTYEKTIFVGMNKAGNDEFNSSVTSIPNSGFNGLYGTVAQTSVAPTILRHLGITIQPEWQLASAPLIGEDGPRKVMQASQGGNSVFWYSQSSNSANIYRNNQLVGTIAGNQGNFTDTTATIGLNTYTVELNGATGSFSMYGNSNNLSISAALDWNDLANNTAYFFRNDYQYVRYNKSNDSADAGYPKPVNSSTWPGLDSYKELISASFKWHNQYGYFFMSDGRYLKYDMSTDQVLSGYPKQVNNSTWPGLQGYGDKIVAALNWDNDKAYFFLNDGTYISYSISNDQVDTGYPKAIDNSSWSGLEPYGNAITAALDWDSTYCYFFLSDNTYIKYNKSTNTAESGYPKAINSSSWPGLM
ncbi:alkaline phosphatase family protein [Limibacter armeniacum]|uniref:alkaline phosphatase family protein n=1 Tax=Limibacter armeniacum TaxID=466084 RepID=UPI002FE6A202